jgi:galactose mutarotase-like enzyme
MIYIIKNKYLTVSVDSEGGSLHSINYLGEERQWQGGEAWKSRDVVIFPIVGHAGDYEVDGTVYTPKSHGVARYSEFALADIGEDKLTLALSSNAVTKKTYPFDFDFAINYTLKKNSIKVTYTVKAKSGTIPFYVGGHPGMYAPNGEAEIEFEDEEKAKVYPLDGTEPYDFEFHKKFKVDKAFFAKWKTLQLSNLSGGKIYAHTNDGYKYTYKTDCPVVAFWSNENSGDYVCVEPWWGINDSETSPKELSKKPFINFADTKGKSFSYTLSIEKE